MRPFGAGGGLDIRPLRPRRGLVRLEPGRSFLKMVQFLGRLREEAHSGWKRFDGAASLAALP